MKVSNIAECAFLMVADWHNVYKDFHTLSEIEKLELDPFRI